MRSRHARLTNGQRMCDGVISEEADNDPEGEPATGDTQSTSSQNQTSMRNETARRKERQRVVYGRATLEPARYGQQTSGGACPEHPALTPSTRTSTRWLGARLSAKPDGVAPERELDHQTIIGPP